MTHAAITESMAERLQELGGIAAQRVRAMPAPGTANLDDLIRFNDHCKPLCELVDNTLVYTSPVDVTLLDEEATITGGDVLPEFTCAVADFFQDLEPHPL